MLGGIVLSGTMAGLLSNSWRREEYLFLAPVNVTPRFSQLRSFAVQILPCGLARQCIFHPTALLLFFFFLGWALGSPLAFGTTQT